MGKEPNTVNPEVNQMAGGARGMDPATHFRSHILMKIQTPTWGNHGDKDLPLLTSPQNLSSKWEIDFDGAPKEAMKTYAFQARPGSTVKYIGVTARSGSIPEAYLIYFRHTAQASDYPNGAGLLEKGVGDYLEGRMQVSRQISASGKNVAAIVPAAVGGSGEFESNEKFVTQCLEEIDLEVAGSSRPLPPLLLACNSDGILKMNNFIKSCPELMKKVKAVYDFDGSHVIAARNISLSGLGARVFRYDGLGALTRHKGEDESSFLNRTMNSNPARVPLPADRWIKNYKYTIHNPKILHFLIPTCMLHHGLHSTSGI